MLLHVGAFRLDQDGQKSSLWHCLTPQTRILCTLLLVFAISLTPNGRWLTWAVYGCGILSLLLISRVTLSVLLQRVAVEFSFIVVVLVGTLFHGDGEIFWQWGDLKVTTAGLTVLGSVTLKALLSLVIVNVLVLTTSVPSLLHALVTLRTPPLLVAILAAMYRYIAVLVDEFQAMKRAAIARNLMGNRRWQRLVIGNMMGSLFIRSYERGERIHQAMLARGYDGLPPLPDIHPPTWRDSSILTLIALLTLVGQVVYLF